MQVKKIIQFLNFSLIIFLYYFCVIYMCSDYITISKSLNFTVLVPLSFILYDVQLRYRPASRDLKRIGSVSLSPIYAHFSDTLSGLATIRSMKATRRFVSENEEKVEANTKVFFKVAFFQKVRFVF